MKLFKHIPNKKVKNIDDNVLVFKIPEDLSKPEIKQYIEKLYNMKVEKVNTARFMGKVIPHSENPRNPDLTKNFKKAYVFFSSKIPADLNQ